MMDLGNTNLFHKGFCTVLFSSNEQNAGTLPHIAQQIHVFLLKTKGKKLQRKITKRKVSLELSHQRLVHRSTRSLLDVDNVIFWQEIELRVDTDPFCTSCQISTINKNPVSKTPLNPNIPFKWVFTDIIPSISFNFFNKICNFC